jgi:hypothetical protein
MKLYCNGVAVATSVIGAKAIATSSSNLRISGDENNHVYFDGLIDEPSVYSRALSAAEIAAIYNAGSAGKCALAPSILLQPQSRAVDPGSSVTFTAAAGGSPPLGYQCQLNHIAIPGATASALTLTNVQASQAGSYLLIVTNAAGSATSSDALLTLLPPPPCTPPVAGLVSWWPGEGGANDVVSTNNGTLQGGATFVAGLVGQAFNFDPASGTVIVPDSASLRLTSQLTIEAWIKTRGTSTDYSIVSKMGGAAGNNGYQFFLSGNTLVGIFNSPGEIWPSARIASGGLIATGVWYHVAWTYDQSAMKLYCNGVAVATNLIGAKAIASSSSSLRISGDGNDHVYFNGLIDEPAVYRRALSATEIAAIYNAGSAGKCPVAPVVHTAPLSQTIECASNVTFSVSATGMAPLAYRWYFGANSISGATNALLTLPNVGFAQAGSYSVIVINAYGYTTGGPVLLTVVDTTPPTITACASNRSFSAGAN